jgi:hypothetical protein
VRPSPHLPKPRAENPAPCVSLPYRGFTAASDVGGHHTPPADPPEASHALRVFTGTEPAGAKSYPAPPPRRTRPTELPALAMASTASTSSTASATTACSPVRPKPKRSPRLASSSSRLPTRGHVAPKKTRSDRTFVRESTMVTVVGLPNDPCGAGGSCLLSPSSDFTE